MADADGQCRRPYNWPVGYASALFAAAASSEASIPSNAFDCTFRVTLPSFCGSRGAGSGEAHQDPFEASNFCAAGLFYVSGKKQRELWYLNDNNHRIDGPADILYYESGKVDRECWYFDDIFHRVDGPALISYYKSGKIKEEV